MLVLTRKMNETIVIGGGNSGYPEMKITIVDIRGDKCRLGVMASKDVPVHRQEVYEAIQREHAREAKATA